MKYQILFFIFSLIIKTSFGQVPTNINYLELSEVMETKATIFPKYITIKSGEYYVVKNFNIECYNKYGKNVRVITPNIITNFTYKIPENEKDNLKVIHNSTDPIIKNQFILYANKKTSLTHIRIFPNVHIHIEGSDFTYGSSKFIYDDLIIAIE